MAQISTYNMQKWISRKETLERQMRECYPMEWIIYDELVGKPPELRHEIAANKERLEKQRKLLLLEN